MKQDADVSVSNKPVAQAIGSTEKAQSFDPVSGMKAPSPTGEKYAEIQQNLSKALADPNTGGAVYDKLRSILGPGEQEALDNHVRSLIAAKTPEGKLALHPDKIDGLLGPKGAGARALDPQEAQKLALMNAARRISNVSTTGASKRRALAAGITHGLSGEAMKYAGMIAGHSAHGLVGSLAGYGLTSMAEAGIGKLLGRHLKNSELAGAKGRGLTRRILGGAGNLTFAPHGNAVANVINRTQRPQRSTGGLLQEEYEKDRRARASGGMMKERSPEELADRLMSLVDKAKKTTQGETKHLLNAPDEAIVRALAVAQKGI
jgi:peptidoglycan hydrolase-like protein with peptidoglycan-binding domain